MNRDEVLQQALSLPPTDQAFVAEMLVREIATTQSIPRELSEAWSMDIDRGVAAYLRGKMARIDFDQ